MLSRDGMTLMQDICKQRKEKIIIYIRKAKICLEMKIAKEHKVNPKFFYKYLNSKIKIKPEIGNIILKNGKTAQSDKETAGN